MHNIILYIKNQVAYIVNTANYLENVLVFNKPTAESKQLLRTQEHTCAYNNDTCEIVFPLGSYTDNI